MRPGGLYKQFTAERSGYAMLKVGVQRLSVEICETAQSRHVKPVPSPDAGTIAMAHVHAR